MSRSRFAENVQRSALAAARRPCAATGGPGVISIASAVVSDEIPKRVGDASRAPRREKSGSLQHVANGGGAADRLRALRAGLQQQFDDLRVPPAADVPAMLGPVNRPADRRSP